MPTESKLERVRETRLVALGLVLALVAVGLIGLVEKGPVSPAVPTGPSPLNPLSYGTLSLYELAVSKYRATAMLNPRDLHISWPSRCVFVVISPTRPIEYREAVEIVSTLRYGCGELAVLVADEETTSNDLLRALNSTIEIAGNRVGIHLPTGISYYPEAVISLGRITYTITLDLASEVSGGVPVGIVHGRVVTYPEVISAGSLATNTSPKLGAVVASEEIVGGVHVFVLGDGSIFLNQVMNSGVGAYRWFVGDLLEYLCGGSECLVVFDGYHYDISDPVSLLTAYTRNHSASPADLLYLSMAIALPLLHPSIWLPLLVSTVDSILRNIIISEFMYLLIPILALCLSRFIIPWRVRVSDRPLQEQVESDVYLAAELRERVLGGRVRLGAVDFANLYRLVDLLAAAVLGVGLGDGSFPQIAGRYVGVERARRYWDFMNRIYRRAIGSSRWPLLVLWGRTVRRALDESEEILRAIGASLEEVSTVEYLATAGGG